MKSLWSNAGNQYRYHVSRAQPLKIEVRGKKIMRMRMRLFQSSKLPFSRAGHPGQTPRGPPNTERSNRWQLLGIEWSSRYLKGCLVERGRKREGDKRAGRSLLVPARLGALEFCPTELGSLLFCHPPCGRRRLVGNFHHLSSLATPQFFFPRQYEFKLPFLSHCHHKYQCSGPLLGLY
jgi:hypothetical protein